MKKIKTSLFFVIMLLMVMTVSVFAAEPGIEISGDSEAKAGDTKTLTVKIISEEDMGVFSGKLAGDGNISDIQVTSKNSWNLLAYENGSFKLVKTQGGKNEDALEISYTIKSDATGKATITLSSIDLTTTEYETKSIADVTKEITIKGDDPIVSLTNIEISKAPTKVKYQEGEKFNKDGMEVKATYSDNTSKVITNYTYSPEGALTLDDKKIVISYSENGVTKTVEQAITVEKKAQTNNNTVNNNTINNNTVNNNTVNNNTVNNNTIKNNTTNTQKQNATIIIGTQNKTDNTVANKELSKAGASDVVFYLIMTIAVLGTIFYIKYNKMNDIK